MMVARVSSVAGSQRPLGTAYAKRRSMCRLVGYATGLVGARARVRVRVRSQWEGG